RRLGRVRAGGAALPLPACLRRRREPGRAARRRVPPDRIDQGRGRRGHAIAGRAVRAGAVVSEIDPAALREAIVSPRWTALTRADLDLASVGRWDPELLRESRVLVPVDVQALYVPAGSTEAMVRIQFALTEPDGEPPAAAPDPFDPGQARPPRIHLHWAMPDALLRGPLATR